MVRALEQIVGDKGRSGDLRMIDESKILPTWRFVLDPQMAVDANKFFNFISSWPPYGWTDDQIKRWVEKTIIGRMPENWAMIHLIDKKLGGLISETLRVMTYRPRDLPPGYVYLFGEVFHGVTGPAGVVASCRMIWEHKRKGSSRTILEPGEEDYDDSRMVSASVLSAEAKHTLDRATVE